MEIFIFLFLFFYLFLSLYRLDWAVLLLLAGLPSYLLRFEVMGLPSTVLEGMILISFGVWLLTRTNFSRFFKGEYKVKDYIRNSQKRRGYPFGPEMIALLLISFVAVGVSGFNMEALGLWRAYFFEPLLVFILVINLFQRREDIYRVITALSVSALAVAGFAIIQKFTGWMMPAEYWGEDVVNRVTSFYDYPNAVGLLVAPISLAALGVFLRKIKRLYEVHWDWMKNFSLGEGVMLVISLLTVLSSWTAIIWARSEGAAAGVVVALVAFGLLYGKRTRIVSVAILILIGGFIYSYTPAQEYVTEKTTLSDLSGEIRKVQWSGAWEMLSEEYRWFTGTGLAGYQETVASYRPPGLFFNKYDDPDFRRKIVLFNEEYKSQFWQPLEVYLYPHNIFLNFWTELGLLGMLLFVWIMIKYFYYGYKSLSGKERELSLALIISLIAIIIHGLVDVPYFKNDLAVQFWVLVALVSLVHRKEKLEIGN